MAQLGLKSDPPQVLPFSNSSHDICHTSAKAKTAGAEVNVMGVVR